MAEPPKTTPATDVEPNGRPELPVLRFGLRQLFWFLTVVCLVLAAVVAAPTPGAAPLALLLAVLVVVFHVLGTALGSRLRDHADDQRAWDAAHTPADNSPLNVPPPTTARSSWHERGQPIRWRWRLVAAGATIGGLLGVVVFTVFDTLESTLTGIAVGAVSMAVVGGWFAFLATSFWTMLRRGWTEAVAEARKDEVRPQRDQQPR